MKKAFKYRLYPNKEQTEKLTWTLTRCRELYNAGLQERKEAYKYAGKTISYYDQAYQLPEIKELRPEYKDIYAQVLQDTLRRVQRSIDNFFRRVKAGETPGYPRFKGRNQYDSFTYPQVSVVTPLKGPQLQGNRIDFPKIGSVKVKLHCPVEGTIKTCSVKREGEHWYCIFVCEVDAPEKLPLSYEDIGIDLGVTHLATLSTGETIEHPRYYRKAEKKLERLQQSLSRKKRGSHRRDKARKLVAKAHRKVRNQRRDFMHKESRKLVNAYQVIVFEDIQAANLSKRPKPKQDEEGKYLPNNASAKAGLNKSIRDAGWNIFVEMCTYKAASAGRTLLQINPQYTSQICSGCGQVRKKELDERWHSCECGCELDRDHNAAINILRLGQSRLAQVS